MLAKVEENLKTVRMISKRCEKRTKNGSRIDFDGGNNAAAGSHQCFDAFFMHLKFILFNFGLCMVYKTRIESKYISCVLYHKKRIMPKNINILKLVISQCF